MGVAYKPGLAVNTVVCLSSRSCQKKCLRGSTPSHPAVSCKEIKELICCSPAGRVATVGHVDTHANI